MSDWIARRIWRAFRRLCRPGLLTVAGPVALVVVILTWAALVVIGCALVYRQHFDAFVPATAGGAN